MSEAVDRNEHGFAVEVIGTVAYLRAHDTLPARAEETLRAAARELGARGVTHWHMNVKLHDVAAARLCERVGMQREHSATALRFPWDRLIALPGEAATVLPVAAEEDDDIERSLGLLAGQLAMARLHPTYVLTQLRDADCAAVGFAAFDPGFPAAKIFRVARPTLAAALLGSLRPHARHPELALVLDDDDETASLLIAHGACVKLRLLHYSGALPQ